MKITLVLYNPFTNDARVHKEASTLASAGHTVTVVAVWQEGLAEHEQQSGYQIIRLRLRSRRWHNRVITPAAKYLEFTWRVWQLAERNPAQVYHANDAHTLPAAWLAARRNRAKIIYDAHEFETGRNFSHWNMGPLYRIIWALPEQIFIRQANSVITVSPSIAAELSRIYRIPLPNVILNCPEKATIQRSNRLRQELGIPEYQKIIIYQGIVVPGRGIEAFLAAIQQVENTVGVVLGDGPALTFLRQRMQSGEWERIYFAGMVPLADLPSYTAAADVGIILTQNTCLNHYYSLPNKLFEYLHAGLPVVCSDLPEISRVVREYQVGELANPDDPVSIARSIRTLLADPARYTQAKANTRKAAEAFNWQNESKKLLEIYAKL